MINKANMKIFRLGLKIETPTYIGGGSEQNINRTQYYYDKQKGKIAVIDQRKFVQLLNRYRLFELYQKYITENSEENSEENIKSKKGKDIQQWISSLYRIRLDQDILSQCVKYYVKPAKALKTTFNDINCFIKDAYQRPYIPGSSIKGAIRTAILVSEIMKNKHIYKSYWQDITRAVRENKYKEKQKKKKLNSIISKLQAQILHYNIGDNKDFKAMSGLSVSDTTTFSIDNLAVIKKVDIRVDNKRANQISLYREYALPGTRVEFDLRLDLNVMNRKIHIKSIDDIYRILSDMYSLLYGQKGLFTSVYPVQKLLPDCVIKDNKGILMMGGGAGYYTKAAVLAALAPSYDELRDTAKFILHKNTKPKIYNHLIDNVICPRTIKIAEYSRQKMLVGLCRIYKIGE